MPATTSPRLFILPRPGLRWIPVWRRNFLVWRKLALPSVLGNLADPLIYMLGLGYGLGGLLPEVGGVSYVTFLAAGTVVAAAHAGACRRRSLDRRHDHDAAVLLHHLEPDAGVVAAGARAHRLVLAGVQERGMRVEARHHTVDGGKVELLRAD